MSKTLLALLKGYDFIIFFIVILLISPFALIIISITISILIFNRGIYFLKSFLKHRNLDISYEKSLIINLPWFIFSLLGVSYSFIFGFWTIIYGFFIFNLIDIFIIFLNIIVGTFFLMRFYEKEIKDSLITVTIIQAILFGIKILLELFFAALRTTLFLLIFSDEMIINFGIYLIGFAVISGFTIFFIYWGDKIQLIQWKNFIFLIAIIPGLIYLSFMYITQPFDFSNMAFPFPIILIPIIISIFIALIGKRISYTTIPYRELGKIKSLEKDVNLLEVKDLKVYYPLLKGVLKKQIGAVKAVDGVSFNIKTGETVGLVGESGCGKTTIALTILGLVEKNGGEILLGNEPLPTEYSAEIRKRVQMVFQDPDASLNPQMKVVDIIAEPLKNMLGITNNEKIRRHVLRLMEEVSLKREHMDRYPHEFSGGQKQRIVIARALACNPELIILDEPTSALDVSVQAQILNLLKDLQKTYNYGFLFITHNLSVVNHIADRIAVMYLGKFVEFGNKKQIFSNPTHPYTRALLISRSEVSAEDQEIPFVLEGEVPSPIAPPPGCTFHPRCYSKVYNELCRKENPHKMEVEEGHYIWCVNEEVLAERFEFL